MTDYNANSDREFIKRLVAASLILLLVFAALGLLVYSNRDFFRAFTAERLASAGKYESACDMARGISDDVQRQNMLYEVAAKMQEQGEYEYAALLFAELGTVADSGVRRLACLYAHADELYAAGNFEEARLGFEQLGSYSDAAQRQLQCIYAGGEAALAEGDYLQALSLFSGLGDYSDAKDRAYEAAFEICGDEQSARVLAGSGGMSAEEVERAAELAGLRSALPLGRLDAGRNHTLYLRDDGSAAACGDNSAGQCDVGGWSGIVQLCAGAEHSLALRSDGTVLAAGSNEYGQCDVGQWKNVVSIAAGDYDSLALCADGTVLSSGYHDYESLEQAQGIKALFAGSYAAAGITEYGYLISSHKSVTAEKPQLVLELAIGTGYTAALYSDGSLRAGVLENGGWENVVYAEAAPRALLALDRDGKLLSHFFRESDRLDFSSLGPVQLCAAGSAHYVFICADGSLRAFGDNSFGQCNVEKLIS